MKGYFKNSDATAEVLDKDQWFKTGDIGYFDDKNNLSITGRSKKLTILESGKKVHPEEVEKAFDDVDFIQEISVFGDKSKTSSNSQKVILMAYLNEDFSKSHDSEAALKILTKEVHNRSDRLASYKMPSEIIISKEERPKTTTMKVKHFRVAQKYFKGSL